MTETPVICAVPTPEYISSIGSRKQRLRASQSTSLILLLWAVSFPLLLVRVCQMLYLWDTAGFTQWISSSLNSGTVLYVWLSIMQLAFAVFMQKVVKKIFHCKCSKASFLNAWAVWFWFTSSNRLVFVPILWRNLHKNEIDKWRKCAQLGNSSIVLSISKLNTSNNHFQNENSGFRNLFWLSIWTHFTR